MPAFTFEKISPSARRAPTATAPKKPRSVIGQVIERIAERRGRRSVQDERTLQRDEKPTE